jgi:hypothetical protein
MPVRDHNNKEYTYSEEIYPVQTTDISELSHADFAIVSIWTICVLMILWNLVRHYANQKGYDKDKDIR